MNEATISPLTAGILKAAGWTPAREVDTRSREQILQSEGYSLLPSAVTFLRSFGGLELVHPNVEAPGRNEHIFLDVERAVAGFAFGWAQRYMQRLGEPLAAIGTAYTNYLLLLMNAQGAVYGGFDEFLCYVGSSGIEALDNLCCGRRLPEIGAD